MDYENFYKQLFAPLEKSIGPIDRETLFAIMGFDGGGPLNFSTIGRKVGSKLVTYISCELAVRPEQKPTKKGGYRYEFLCSCDDERWVRRMVTSLGRMSLDVAFDQGHTIDIGPLAGENVAIQGILLQEECRVEIEHVPFGILRCIGITRDELEFAMTNGARELMGKLMDSKLWPNTIVSRASAVAPSVR